MEDYLTKIAELCRGNNVKLIFTNIPGSHHEYDLHNTVGEFVEKYGDYFMDFCGSVASEGVTEKKDNKDTIWIFGELPSENMTHQIFSAGSEKEKSGYVILSGQQYAMKSQGIIVVVYNNLQHHLADVAFFTPDSQGHPVRKDCGTVIKQESA